MRAVRIRARLRQADRGRRELASVTKMIGAVWLALACAVSVLDPTLEVPLCPTATGGGDAGVAPTTGSADATNDGVNDIQPQGLAGPLMQDGFIFVWQDLRGRFKSEGTFEMMLPTHFPVTLRS